MSHGRPRAEGARRCREGERAEAFRLNDEAVGLLADAAEQHGARLLHPSTDYVFSGDFEDEAPAELKNRLGLAIGSRQLLDESHRRQERGLFAAAMAILGLGVTVGQVFPVDERWHPLLVRAFAGIPDIQAGDSVWWHADVIHGVAPVEDQQGWGNVMYIPAAPWCARNAVYAEQCGQDFLAGRSPGDFAAEDYEVDFVNRAGPADLNDTGRRQLALDR